MSGRREGRLAGKIAFITGAGGGGQGRTACRMFADEGAIIVGCDLIEEDLAATQALIAENGGAMHSFGAVDLTNREAVRSWIEQGCAEAGGIDILYNNAGALRFAPLASMSIEDWRFNIANELEQVFNTTQYAWPHLAQRGGGSVIITSSGSGLRGNRVIGAAGHAAAKAGLDGFMRQAAAEGATSSIRVNCISPGGIETPQLRANLSREVYQRAVDAIPLGRLGLPEDIGHLAVYLASDESTWVTGSTFVIDGGVHAMR